MLWGGYNTFFEGSLPFQSFPSLYKLPSHGRIISNHSIFSLIVRGPRVSARCVFPYNEYLNSTLERLAPLGREKNRFITAYIWHETQLCAQASRLLQFHTILSLRMSQWVRVLERFFNNLGAVNGLTRKICYVPSIWRKLGIQMRRHFSSSRIREVVSQQTLDFIGLSPRSIQIISIHRKKYKIGEHIAIRMLKSLVAIGAEIFCPLPADPRKYRRYKYERRSVAWMHRPQRGVWGWPWLHDWWLNRRSHWHNCHGVHRAVFAMASHQIICGRGRVVQ